METHSMMKRAFLFLSLVAAPVWSSVPRKPVDDLARHRSQVMELGAKLSSLEKEIGTKNNLYLSSIQQIRQFEADVKLYRDHLTKVQADVKEGVQGATVALLTRKSPCLEALANRILSLLIVRDSASTE